MPQLQAMGGLIHLADGSYGRCVKLIGAVGIFRKGQQLFFRIIGEIQSHDLGRTLLIAGAHQSVQKALVNLGNLLRGQQTAVAGESHFNCFCGIHPHSLISCAVILHIVSSLSGFFVCY